MTLTKTSTIIKAMEKFAHRNITRIVKRNRWYIDYVKNDVMMYISDTVRWVKISDYVKGLDDKDGYRVILEYEE